MLKAPKDLLLLCKVVVVCIGIFGTCKSDDLISLVIDGTQTLIICEAQRG